MESKELNALDGLRILDSAERYIVACTYSNAGADPELFNNSLETLRRCANRVRAEIAGRIGANLPAPAPVTAFKKGTHGWIIESNAADVRKMRDRLNAMNTGAGRTEVKTAVEHLTSALQFMHAEFDNQAITHPEDLRDGAGDDLCLCGAPALNGVCSVPGCVCSTRAAGDEPEQ